jgi:nitrilase
VSNRGEFRVTAVQATPAHLDRERTLDIAADHIARAGTQKTDLVVFPEAFVPGYPDFVWRLGDRDETPWADRLRDQAVEIGGTHLDGVRSAAAAASVWVALGISEMAPSGVLYNAVVYIDDDGEIAGLHRKLVPTGPEARVWAHGEGPMLTVVDIEGVRVGTLICWENYMPLARAALYEKGVDVLLAPTWDNSEEWLPTLRHIAKEGRVFVIGASAFLRGCDVTRDLPGADAMYGGADDLLSRGNSTIIAPGGEIIAGPLIGEGGTITETLELDHIAAGRLVFDPAGRHARPDVLSLSIHEGGNRNE